MIQLVKLSHIDINVVVEGLKVIAKSKRHNQATRKWAADLARYIDVHHVLPQYKGQLPK